MVFTYSHNREHRVDRTHSNGCINRFFDLSLVKNVCGVVENLAQQKRGELLKASVAAEEDAHMGLAEI